MRGRRVDQNSAIPIDTSQRFTHVHPIYSEDKVAVGPTCILVPAMAPRLRSATKSAKCIRTFCILSGFRPFHISPSEGTDATS